MAVGIMPLQSLNAWILEGLMTLQQLKYMITAAEAGSITEAAKELFISQPSLSGAVKEVEKKPVYPSLRGAEQGLRSQRKAWSFWVMPVRSFSRWNCLNQNTFPISRRNSGLHINAALHLYCQRLCWACSALWSGTLWVYPERNADASDYHGCKNRFSDIGILYFSNGNKSVLQKSLEENDLVFYELFAASPHVFLCKDHPLANQNSLKLKDLQPYPKLSFVQGNYESDYFAEELFSNEPAEKASRSATVPLL